MAPIIEVSNITKRYRLGQFGAKSLREDMERLWNKSSRKTQSTDASENSKNDFWALRDVSFSVEPGEVVGIIGRNGAGKSTLLKILSRITLPTQGEIVLRGRVASLLEVGTGFHPELSGRENIFLNGAILGMKRAEIAAKFDEIVDFAEVDQFVDTPVKRYSSGMYVRLAFAVAAHLEPEILIVDEVLAVGDAKFQRRCIERMREISSSHGRTVLFVSHTMSAVRRLCNRCLVMDKGQLALAGSVDEAVELYLRDGPPATTDLDVSKRHRDWGTTGTTARILRIQIPGGEHIRFGSPFDLDITIEVYEPIDHVMVGFAFNTTEGQRVMTLDSDGDGETWTFKPGKYLIHFHLDRMPVSPGRYLCGAAIGGLQFYDSIDPVAQWEVISGMNDWESQRGFGGCRIPPKATCTEIL